MNGAKEKFERFKRVWRWIFIGWGFVVGLFGVTHYLIGNYGMVIFCGAFILIIIFIILKYLRKEK